MENFTAYNPTQLHFGKDIVSNMNRLVRPLGKKVLLMYGKGSVLKNGSYDAVKKELEKMDAQIFEYNESTDYIKRIIGLPGEEISIQNGAIHINNQRLDENAYLEESISTLGGDYLQEGTSIQISASEYFVCGDNRPNSSDSRDFGPINRDQIKGRAWLVYFPFSDFRLITHSNILLNTE